MINRDVVQIYHSKICIKTSSIWKQPMGIPMRGSDLEDRMGKIMGDILASLGRTPINEPEINTFIRRGYGSAPDGCVKGRFWHVLNEEAFSPHKFISFEVKGEEPVKERWIFRSIKRVRAREALIQLTEGESDISTENLKRIFQESHATTTAKIRTMNGCRTGGHRISSNEERSLSQA